MELSSNAGSSDSNQKSTQTNTTLPPSIQPAYHLEQIRVMEILTARTLLIWSWSHVGRPASFHHVAAE